MSGSFCTEKGSENMRLMLQVHPGPVSRTSLAGHLSLQYVPLTTVYEEQLETKFSRETETVFTLSVL